MSPIAVLEVQGFRGTRERELIFTAYAHAGGEVMGVDLGRRDVPDGSATNYSNSPVYEEVEGIAPDGSYVLVDAISRAPRRLGHSTSGACRSTAAASSSGSPSSIDTGAVTTRTNPTVSPDGRTIAFQLSFDGPVEGEGQGILLFDVDAFESAGE